VSDAGNETPVFEVRELHFRYEGAARPALDKVNLQVAAGDLYAIIGPNGSGKSTLLKLLLGALRPQGGDVFYGGRRVAGWNRRALAQQIGVVPQGEEMAFPITVREMVAMGRYPHLGVLGRAGPEDRAAIEEAMQRCDVIELAERPISRLSGGERQRALIARALAQRPATLVLDEPTVSLDIRHEMEIFELLAEVTARDRVTVLLVTHHLNLAARYADRLLLLDRGTPAAEGAPAEVLSRETIERVYQWAVMVGAHPGPGPDTGAPQITPLAGGNENERRPA
jgi:iron complex transport system ATP-binding protein